MEARLIKRLKKVGNGHALFLDKALMELVGLKEDGEVQLTVDNGNIRISPVRPGTISDEEFQEAMDRVFTERRELLRRLAE